MKEKFVNARSRNSTGGASSGRAAFTLVELLVIIGMLALLAVIQVSAMAGKRDAKMAMCAGNVRQITAALHLYASDNNDKLPVATGSAVWAWDLPSSVADKLLSAGLQKRTFYCPGTSPRFTDRDNYQNPAFGNNLWDFGVPNFHIIGYSLALAGSASRLSVSNQNTTVQSEPVRQGGLTLSPPPNAQRVLVADATISVSASGRSALNNYTSIQGGFIKPHTSPHLRGDIPDGGNLGFKDGHVEWRSFDIMDPRTVSGPYFWW